MSPLTFSILRTLSDGEFHSGENLARRFHVSRATIWNALQDLDQAGVRLYKIRGRGYQLADPIEWLDRDLISKHAGARSQAIDIQLIDVAESTNAMLMQRAMQVDGAQCVVAEMQTQGRGRRGRVWHGALGGSLTFSLLWRFDFGVSQLSGLSLAVGVALVRALNALGYADIRLKWPNDLVHAYRKLGGVLIELQGDAMGPSTAVIGVGLNLRLPDTVKNKVDQAIVDLRTLDQTASGRNALMGTILRHMVEMLEQFESAGFEALSTEWEQAHAYHGKPVVIKMPDGAEIYGKVRGVAPDGALMLDTPSGERRFGSGEISMRPAPAPFANELPVE